MNAQAYPATHLQYLCHYNDMKTLNCSFITVGVEYNYYYTRLSVIIKDSYTCISYSADSCLLSHKGIILLILPDL